jgi:hypothetical protein
LEGYNKKGGCDEKGETAVGSVFYRRSVCGAGFRQ